MAPTDRDWWQAPRRATLLLRRCADSEFARPAVVPAMRRQCQIERTERRLEADASMVPALGVSYTILPERPDLRHRNHPEADRIGVLTSRLGPPIRRRLPKGRAREAGPG